MTASGAFLGTAADRVRGSVVQVLAGPDGARGGGAGIAWRPYLVVTSAHVATSAHVTIVRSDGHRLRGEVIERDTHRDLALVRVPLAAMPVVAAADPSALRPGSLIFAIGHPFGVKDAVSTGVLQAVGPLPRGFGPNGKTALRWVQADVRLAPGNSGGPLADTQGRVIGVATLIVAGLALAVPAPDVERLVASRS